MNSASTVLAYIPSPPRGVWDLGPIPLRAYAVCIIIGIVTAIYWGDKRWVARGGKQGTILDIAMFAVPFGLVGGRMYHVATDWKTYFGPGGDPMGAFKVWEGGLGIWGAVLLGGVGAWIGCRVFRIPLPPLADAIAPAILLAQAIGRLGNYFNQELFGRVTTVPWGLKIYERYDSDGHLDNLNGVSTGVVEKVVHPTFLYEMIWNILVVIALVVIDKRYRIGHGRLFALYVAAYCFGRFFVELMRDDYATHVFGVRINVFTSIVVFCGALAYFLVARRGRETPEDLAPADRPWPWQPQTGVTPPGSAAPAADAADSSADAETAAAETDSDAEQAEAKPEEAKPDDKDSSDAPEEQAQPEQAAESAEPADAEPSVTEAEKAGGRTSSK